MLYTTHQAATCPNPHLSHFIQPPLSHTGKTNAAVRDMAKESDNGASNRSVNKGAWTAEEDRTLAQYVQIHGPRRWKSVAIQSGLKRCGKSCRLRWLNYLRPNIKRGDMSGAEDDLILRLHRLLGNRWSLIAKRLPGRTDNEIKNYWNAHLRKKAKLMEKLPAFSTALEQTNEDEGSLSNAEIGETEGVSSGDSDDESFDFSTKGTHGLTWVKTFLELDEDDL